MSDQLLTAAFTGHRDIPERDYNKILTALFAVLDRLYAEGYRRFITGGALGFDTLAALAVLKWKSRFPTVSLIVAVPCPTQTRGWKPDDLSRYELILSKADEVVTLAEKYFRGCMQMRNRYMVDHADRLVAYVTRDTGGSAYTRHYAERKGIPITDITDFYDDTL